MCPNNDHLIDIGPYDQLRLTACNYCKKMQA